jgi:hypothetical protein
VSARELEQRLLSRSENRIDVRFCVVVCRDEHDSLAGDLPRNEVKNSSDDASAHWRFSSTMHKAVWPSTVQGTG